MAGESEIEFKSAHDLAVFIASLQAECDMFENFAEDVLLMCAMPDVERFVLEGRYEGHIAENAMTALMKSLSRLRKLEAFLIKNHIDIDNVVSEKDDKPKS